MARMPGAIWKPLAADWNKQPRMKAYDFFCLHTMVGGLDGTDGYFRNKNGIGYGGTESHFGVGPDGTIYQWQDTDFQADANGNGNWHVISSENADTGAPFPNWGGSDVPAMTPQQVEANAKIAAWLWRTHGIPLDLTPDSKPGRRGLAVHRWGVPGYMVAGAEQWSTARGKACPGDRRIAQAPLVGARAKQIAAGAPNQEDDMPLSDDDLDAVRDAVWHAPFDSILDGKQGRQAWEIYRGLEKNAHNAAVQATAAAKQVTGLSSAITALTKLVAEQNGLTVDDVRRVVSEEIAKGVDVDVTVAPGAAA